VTIGRGRTAVGRPGEIRLREPSVSLEHARIRLADGSAWLEHVPSATNPTRVNGRSIQRESLAPGDKIELGKAVLELRARDGVTLTTLLAPTDAQLDADLTVPMQVVPPADCLVLVEGLPELRTRRFELAAPATVIGRAGDCDVVLPEPGVSRRHAELVRRDGGLVLLHHGRANQTLVNGVPVGESRIVRHGDRIQLADQVVLRLELGDSSDERVLAPKASTGSLRTRMEEKLERDREIAERFELYGSFLDVDVIDSYGLKSEDEGPARVIVSFERFRSYVRRLVEEFEGLVFNSNGDELMCFFDNPYQAVRAGSAILERLDEFNRGENLLQSPFRFRLGVHTGTSLVDRERRVAYSHVLDVAGHMQKSARPNSMLISQDTMRALPPDLPFEAAGKLERHGLSTFRLTRPLGSADDAVFRRMEAAVASADEGA